MIVTVLGKAKKSYKDKTSGEMKSYAKVHGSYKFPKSETVNGNEAEGQKVIEFYVDVEDYTLVEVGAKMSLDYDPNGRLVDYEVLEFTE